jgi:hypothetical protein
VRYALVNNRPLNEFRAGVTFAFKIDGSEPDAGLKTFGAGGPRR